MHGKRNIFGVFPEFGDPTDLSGSKWGHVARVRADPGRDQPALTVRHRRS